MDVRTARLCLDCEEIHEAQQCPRCGSETFAFISRWVGVADQREKPRPEPPPEAEVYRRLLTGDSLQPKAMRLLRRGAFGLAAISLLRWALKTTSDRGAAAAPPDRSSPADGRHES
jgi:hypothetical protein